MSLNINLRNYICFLFMSLSVTYLKVKRSYYLLLRPELISNLLLLQPYRTVITDFKSERSSENLSVAKLKLINEMKGLIGKALQMYKSVNYNDCIC